MKQATHGCFATLAFVVTVATTLCSTRQARAECGDFGGLGVMFGVAGGLGATLVGGFAYPAIAVAAKPGLRYWPGVGYTMAAGAAGTLFGTLAVSGECPYPESAYVPALLAAPFGALTTVIWAAASKPARPQVSLSVVTPRVGQGAVLSFAGRF
jgi:hypothetical protein